MDQVLLYRNEELLSTPDVNLNSLLINSKPLGAFAKLTVADNFNYQTYGSDYLLPLTINHDNLDLVPTNSFTKFVIPSGGYYRFSLNINCDVSDAFCNFKICVESINENVSTQTDSIVNLNLNQDSIIFISDNAKIYVRVVPVSGANLVNRKSWLDISKMYM
jgi:hypothetical protein